MIPTVRIETGQPQENALVAVMAILVADGRLNVEGDHHRAREVREMAQQIIRGRCRNPLDDTRLWDNS